MIENNIVLSNEEIVEKVSQEQDLTDESKKKLLKDLEKDFPTLSKDFQDNLNKGIEKLKSNI